MAKLSDADKALRAAKHDPWPGEVVIKIDGVGRVVTPHRPKEFNGVYYVTYTDATGKRRIDQVKAEFIWAALERRYRNT